MPLSQTQLFNYAMHSHEQAATYAEHKGQANADVITNQLEFAAIDTAFSLLEVVAASHDFVVHQIKVERDDEDDCTVMTFPNGRVVCRSINAEAEEGLIDRMYHQRNPRDNRSTMDVLITELDEVYNTPGVKFS